jgi:hypothetical protein
VGATTAVFLFAPTFDLMLQKSKERVVEPIVEFD